MKYEIANCNANVADNQDKEVGPAGGGGGKSATKGINNKMGRGAHTRKAGLKGEER